MEQKSAQELIGVECHQPLFAAMGVVLPAEGHIAVDEVDQPVVGDCHPMRVAGQIVENVLRSAEGWLGIDDPAFPIERPDEGAK